MREDTSTLAIGPLDSLSGSGRGLRMVPALTIGWHPAASRVGTIAPLTSLLETDTAVLTRDQPPFYTPGSNVGRAIEHRGMSRREPVLVISSADKGLELRRGPATKGEVELGGAPFVGSR